MERASAISVSAKVEACRCLLVVHLMCMNWMLLAEARPIEAAAGGSSRQHFIQNETIE